MALYTNILTIGTLFCRTGEGVSRDMRTIVEAGHRGRQIVTAIDPTGDLAVNQEFLHRVPHETIQRAIRTAFETWTIGAVKLGYLGDAATIEMVADELKAQALPRRVPIVVDPAILNSNGSRNLDEPALSAFKKDLCLIADVINPSVREAEILTGMTIRDPDALRAAGEMLLTLGSKAVFVRGGEMGEDRVIDMLFTETTCAEFVQPRLMKEGVHGAKGYGGVIACTFALGMAQGHNFERMITDALTRVRVMFLSDL
jgi:hydroxymethylpyrimidine/phosphomethylpyrimidine kinase